MTLTRAERRAWRPPERLSPSQWATRHRVLSRAQSSRPGKWNNRNAPYLVGVMDLAEDRHVTEIALKFAAQIGKSEAIRNVIAWVAHNDPDPVLLVLPDQDTAERMMLERIKPLFNETDALVELETASPRDKKIKSIRLSNGFYIRCGWSGSAATLASDPFCYVIMDEVDKFKQWSGREADPISLARVRTQTYAGRSKVITISTPTTRDGYIQQLWDDSDVKLYYFVPCPHCDHYQRLKWDNVRWDDPPGDDAAAKSAHVKRYQTAWYRCAKCEQKIHDTHKPRMLERGCWAVEGVEERLPELAHAAGMGGLVREGWPVGSKVALTLSVLYTAFRISFSDIAAEFLATKGDPARLQNFRNSWLGEVYEEVVVRSPVQVFRAKAETSPYGRAIVPRWADWLFATADVQKDRLYYVVRAWAENERSHRVAHGVVRDLEELLDMTRRMSFTVEGGDAQMRVSRVGIDTGFEPERVYALALRDPLIYPLKGMSNERGRTRVDANTTQYRNKQTGVTLPPVVLNHVPTAYMKDRLAAMIQAKLPMVDSDGVVTGEVDQWGLNNELDGDYERQMASEVKVPVHKRNSTSKKYVWKPVTDGADNHYWDCEVYQLAMAQLAGVGLYQKRIRPEPKAKPKADAVQTRPAVRRRYG